MKKIIKYPLIGLSGIIVGIPVILLLICLILYLPPVQSWGKERIGAAVRSSGIELSIEKLALKFPFDLSLNHFSAVAAASGDPLVYGDELRVRISLPALLRGKAEVKEIRIQKAGYGLQSADSGLSLQADLKQFSLHGATLSWIKKEIVLDSVSLHDTDVSLVLHTNAAKKDTAAAPSAIPWAIRVKRLCLNRTHYRMRMSPTIEDLEVRIDSIAASTGEVRLDRSSVSVQDVTIRGGKAFYLAGKSTAPQDTTASADSTATGSAPWLIDVERIQCSGLDGTYAVAGSKPSAGFDPEYISVRNLSLAVDSFHNYGSTIRLPLRQLALQERSGISIEKAQGLWQMTDSTQSLQNFSLATPYSVIQADADFDTDLDGLPDWWEEINGSNVNSAAGDYSDSHADNNNDGFSTLEDYLAFMASPNKILKPGEVTDIDLKAMFAGYTQSPMYTVDDPQSISHISGSKLTIAAPSQIGIYPITLTVTDGDGASYTRLLNIAVTQKEILNIEQTVINENDIRSYEIYSLGGVKIESGNCAENTSVYTLGLPNTGIGIYLLKVTDGMGMTKSYKIVKDK